MVYVANSRDGGISVLEFDRTSGELLEQGRRLATQGVAPLAASPDRRFLYAAVRTETPAVAAFAVDSKTGELHFLNSVPVPAGPSYMTVDAGGRFLLAASYGGGIVFVLPLGRDGMPQPEPACVVSGGRNPHCVLVDASNRFAYVPYLGNDQVAQYRFDAATGILRPNAPPQIAAPRESGPRHMVIRPDGRYAYVLTELSGEIIKCAIDAENGTLSAEHAVPLMPADRALPPGRYEPPVNASGGANSPAPVMWAADIRISPDGRFLYASERTGSTVSCFTVDPVSGRLDMFGCVDVEERPRGLAMDPHGRFLLVMGEASDHVSAYGIDRESGALAPGVRIRTGEAPTWTEVIVL